MPTTTPETLTEAQIDHFRTEGFVHIPGIISPAEAREFYAAALDVAARTTSRSHGVFLQHVNVWTQDEAMKRLTLHPNVGAVARKLAKVCWSIDKYGTHYQAERVNRPPVRTPAAPPPS